MLTRPLRQQLPAAAPRVAQVPPPAPVKRVEKRRGAHPSELELKATQSCGAQTRARRLLAAEELALPSLKAFWPAR